MGHAIIYKNKTIKLKYQNPLRPGREHNQTVRSEEKYSKLISLLRKQRLQYDVMETVTEYCVTWKL